MRKKKAADGLEVGPVQVNKSMIPRQSRWDI